MPVFTTRTKALFLQGIRDSLASREIVLFNGVQPSHVGWIRSTFIANEVAEYTGHSLEMIGAASEGDKDTIQFNLLPPIVTKTALVDCSSGSPITWFAYSNNGGTSQYAMIGPVSLVGGSGVVALDTLTPALGANVTIQDFRLQYV